MIQNACNILLWSQKPVYITNLHQNKSSMKPKHSLRSFSASYVISHSHWNLNCCIYHPTITIILTCSQYILYGVILGVLYNSLLHGSCMMFNGERVWSVSSSRWFQQMFWCQTSCWYHNGYITLQALLRCCRCCSLFIFYQTIHNRYQNPIG